MEWLGELWRRLTALVTRKQIDRDLEDEMRLHLELRAQQQAEAGIAPDEAHHAAQRRFGNTLLMKETSREVWGWRWLETLAQDLQYALRTLRRSPGFTAVALISLALGIGANTAIFSMLDAVVLRTLPVRDPAQLVQFSYSDGKRENSWFPYPHFERLQRRNHLLSGMFAIGGGGRIAVGVLGEVELAKVEFATGGYYTILGVNPLVGRLFSASDDHPGHPVTVISYAYWQRRFGGDPSIIGSTLVLNRKPFTIIGVTSPEFFGVSVGDSADVTIPLGMRDQLFPDDVALTDAFGDWLRIVGRLTPGVTRQQAQAELDAIYRQYSRELVAIAPPRDRSTAEHDARYLHLELRPAARGFRSNLRGFAGPLTILMIAVGGVLLIACSNIANLLLARAAARQKEIALRRALGAPRSRLIRQLLTESVLLAALGGAVGVLFALWGTRALTAILPSGLEVNMALDIRVLGFTAAVSLATGILFGLAPAFRATRVDLSPAIKETARAGGRRRILDKALVVGEVALSLMLLAVAGLFVRTMQNLWGVDAGYQRENVLMFSIDASLAGYKGAPLADKYRELLAKMQLLPGANSVSLSVVRPIDDEMYWISSVNAIDGRALPPGSQIHVALNSLSPNYFSTMRTPMLLGREFGPQDNQTSPKVAIVSETLARTAFPNQNPIGRHIDAEFGEMEIVGVARDVRYGNLRDTPRCVFYTSFFQKAQPGNATFEVRYSGSAASLLDRVRDAIRSVDKNLPIFRVKTLDVQARESLASERLIAILSSFFGLLALALACVGLYGLLVYAVIRRTSEIGIRMALGASRASVMGMILRESMLLASIGVAMGVLAGMGLTRLIGSFLFGVQPADPLTFSLAALLMIAVTGFASYLPARRAAHLDPMEALHHE